MKKIFVTGADGFIGSHLVELLVEEGFDVTALCIYNSNGSWGWLENLSPVTKKLSVKHDLRAIVLKCQSICIIYINE